MSGWNRITLIVAATLLVASPTRAQDAVRMLVYTKNGPGYVHANIPAAERALQQLGREHGMTVDVSADPAVFTEANLRQYTLLLFASTNNNVFDTEAQRLAFRRYVEAGGGFVGLHSVTGTERTWPWFKMLIGGTFAWHAPFQRFRLRRIDRAHPSVQNLPDAWEKEDEFYFLRELYPGVRVVLAGEIGSLQPGEEERIRQYSAPFAAWYPTAWYQDFDGGPVWITTLGHDPRDYEDAVYLQHVLGGIQFVAGRAHRPDFQRAYATASDGPVR